MRTYMQEIELVEEALFRDAYVYDGWYYYLPMIMTMYLWVRVLEEPWYNTLTEQMFEQVIEEIQPEPFIVSSELDNEINKAVLDLLHNPHEGVGLVEITNRYKNDKSNW